MKKAIISAACLVGAIAGGNVMAQNVAMPEVTVESHRMVETTVGKSTSGIPVVDVSMGYTVSSKGLDISSAIGARAFEARIKDAASAACQELGQRYPNSSTTDQVGVYQAGYRKGVGQSPPTRGCSWQEVTPRVV
jgi:hypothetical protein